MFNNIAVFSPDGNERRRGYQHDTEMSEDEASNGQNWDNDSDSTKDLLVLSSSPGTKSWDIFLVDNTGWISLATSG